MNYNINENEMQTSLNINENFIMIPSTLDGFKNTETIIGITKSGRQVLDIRGELEITKEDRRCNVCGHDMHIQQSREITLRHIPIGNTLSCISFPHYQLLCPNCGFTKMQDIPFKAESHRITKELLQYAKDLLASGKYTLKQVAQLAGLGKNIVKDIDLERLKEKYTINGEQIIKPENKARILGIDEFKLHDGHKYATHIIIWKRDIFYGFHMAKKSK